MKFKKAVQIFVGAIVVLSIILVLMGVSGERQSAIIAWVMPIGISFILTAFVGELVEAFGGKVLKQYVIQIPVWKFKIPVTVFFIVTLLLKWWLF